jgi:hypothetical protein
MKSVQLIRAISRNRIVDQDVARELLEASELEFYRVVVWMVDHTCPRIHKLMCFLGSKTPLYHKMLRWIAPDEYWRMKKAQRPPQEVEAHVANGFKKYEDMYNTTRELVECVA